MPCPHFDVKIIQRSKRQSAVASAAYQSGERLFSEYDQKQKYYSHKSEIVHTEIMLLWSSIFVTFRSKNSLCMSCFKWRLPTIIRMGTDMIIPYAHISPDCFIQTFRTGKTVRID